MVDPTWEARDFPVLKAIVELYEESGVQSIRVGDIQERTGFDEATVQKALHALKPADPPFVTQMLSVAEGMVLRVGAPTPEARRAVGLWPTAEGLADRLVQALAQAAEQEPDEEKRGWLRKTADWLGSAGRDIAVDVAGAAIARSVGAG